MKLKDILTTTLISGALFGLTACSGDKHDEEHGHVHDDKKEHADEDKHTHEDGEEPDEEHGHVHDDKKEHADGDKHTHEDGEEHAHHAPQVAGPNGGRVLMSMEPHAEFFVTEDRKVQVTFVDDDNKAIAPGAQSVSVIAGDRSNPTSLSFVKEGNVLLSEQALPAGDDFPLVFMLKETAASTSPAVEKFTLDLSDCPTCDYLEYACTCEH